MVRKIDPLLSGVPHMRLILAKLTLRQDFEHFIDVAWEAQSPNKASQLGGVLFKSNPPPEQEFTGPGSWGQVAQAIRRMRGHKGSQAPKAKEALIQEIKNRQKNRKEK